MTLLGADPAKWPALEWRQLDYLPLWLPFLFSVLMFCGFVLYSRREDQRREELREQRLQSLLQPLLTRHANTARVGGGPGISAPVRVAGGQLESLRVQTHTEVLEGGGEGASPRGRKDHGGGAGQREGLATPPPLSPAGGAEPHAALQPPGGLGVSTLKSDQSATPGGPRKAQGSVLVAGTGTGGGGGHGSPAPPNAGGGARVSEAPSPQMGEAGGNTPPSHNQSVGDAAGAAPSPNSPHVADAAGAATAHAVDAAGAASTNTTTSWRAPWPFGSWWRSSGAEAAGAATAPTTSPAAATPGTAPHGAVTGAHAAVDETAVSQLRAELATAQGTVATLTGRLVESHAQVASLQAQLRELQAQVRELVALQAQARASQAQEEALQAQVRELAASNSDLTRLVDELLAAAPRREDAHGDDDRDIDGGWLPAGGRSARAAHGGGGGGGAPTSFLSLSRGVVPARQGSEPAGGGGGGAPVARTLLPSSGRGGAAREGGEAALSGGGGGGAPVERSPLAPSELGGATPASRFGRTGAATDAALRSGGVSPSQRFTPSRSLSTTQRELRVTMAASREELKTSPTSTLLVPGLAVTVALFLLNKIFGAPFAVLRWAMRAGTSDTNDKARARSIEASAQKVMAMPLPLYTDVALAVQARSGLKGTMRTALQNYTEKLTEHIRNFVGMPSRAQSAGAQNAGDIFRAVPWELRDELAKSKPLLFGWTKQGAPLPVWIFTVCQLSKDHPIVSEWHDHSGHTDLVWLLSLRAWLLEDSIFADIGLSPYELLHREATQSDPSTEVVFPLQPASTPDATLRRIARLLDAALELEEKGRGLGVSVFALIFGSADVPMGKQPILDEQMRTAVAHSLEVHEATMAAHERRDVRALRELTAMELSSLFTVWSSTTHEGLTVGVRQALTRQSRITLSATSQGVRDGNGKLLQPTGGIGERREGDRRGDRRDPGGQRHASGNKVAWGGDGRGRSPRTHGDRAGGARGDEHSMTSRSASPGRSSANTGDTPRSCYTCGALDHLRADCKHPQTCNICKKPGHIASACPQRQGKPVKGRAPTPTATGAPAAHGAYHGRTRSSSQGSSGGGSQRSGSGRT